MSAKSKILIKVLFPVLTHYEHFKLPFIYRRKSLLIYRDVQNLKFLMREGGGEFTEVIVHKVKNLIQCS